MKGYSLIELTIVVGLVAILSIGISSVVLMNTITANRSRNTILIKEAGDYSLNQLKHLVRNARAIIACNSTNNTLSLQNLDGDTTLISLESPGEVGRIASNSGTYLTPAAITVQNFDLTCLPNSTNPQLIKFSFDSSLANSSVPEREKTTINFETSVEIRND